MNILVDTNVLLRLSDTGSDEHMLCNEAVPRLLQRGDLLHICAQVVIEYWVVATRPQTVNGLGFEPKKPKPSCAILRNGSRRYRSRTTSPGAGEGS